MAGLLMLAVGVAAVAQDRTRPDDPMFEDQWGLENTGQLVNWTEGTPGADIDATRAWNLTTGSRSLVVAVVDGQLDYEAEDLAANAWSNPGGVNGCPAGSHGYDVSSGDCDPYTEGSGHGTSMAYTIGAVGDNGTALTGVNWTTSLMGVSMRRSRDATTIVDAIDWVIDARQAGVNVRVINASWGPASLGNNSSVRRAIRRAGEHGILFVTGAGNNRDDRDEDPIYPCSFDLPNLICAAASDQDDALAPRSSYGAESVHLAAPGHHICGSPHSSCSGGTSTSHATAYVSGVAALVWAYDPGLSVEQVRSKILGNVDKNDALSGKVATGGRLNAYRAMTGPASWTDPSDDGGGDGGGGGSGGSDGDSGDGGSDGSGGDGSSGSDTGDDGGSGGSDDGGSRDGDAGSGDGGDSGGRGSGDDVDDELGDSGGSDGGGPVSVGDSSDDGGRRTVEGSTATPGTGSSGATSTTDDDGQGQAGGSSGAGQGAAGSPEDSQQPGWDQSAWESNLDLDPAGADHDPDDDAEGGAGATIIGGQGNDTASGDDGGVSGWLWVALLAAGGLLAFLARKPGGQVP